MKQISYRKGYKYQLHDNYIIIIPIKGYEIKHDYFELEKNGQLTVMKGYAWDGPSGPAFDTKNFMRGSLVHDTLYQAIEEDFLPAEVKLPADKLLRDMCIEDGMNSLFAWTVYYSVRFYQKYKTLQPKPVLWAP
jgi:hypothetical protein